MENIQLPEFQQEFSQRDGIRKFIYKPPDSKVDLTKIFECAKTMNNSSPKLAVGIDKLGENDSSYKNEE